MKYEDFCNNDLCMNTLHKRAKFIRHLDMIDGECCHNEIIKVWREKIMIKIVFREKERKSIAYDLDKQIGECDFEEINDSWNIIHTEVDSAYQGQGIAKKLVKNVIENA